MLKHTGTDGFTLLFIFVERIPFICLLLPTRHLVALHQPSLFLLQPSLGPFCSDPPNVCDVRGDGARMVPSSKAKQEHAGPIWRPPHRGDVSGAAGESVRAR